MSTRVHMQALSFQASAKETFLGSQDLSPPSLVSVANKSGNRGKSLAEADMFMHD